MAISSDTGSARSASPINSSPTVPLNASKPLPTLPSASSYQDLLLINLNETMTSSSSSTTSPLSSWTDTPTTPSRGYSIDNVNLYCLVCNLFIGAHDVDNAKALIDYVFVQMTAAIRAKASPESWYKSMCNTIFKLFRQRLDENYAYEGHLGLVFKMLADIALDGALLDHDRMNDEKYICSRFQKHVDEVIRTIPADRLLVFELGSGWEPLCKFLGKSVGMPTHTFK
ncbi:hypothetical protein BC940DRAFT_334081 [Gongronella butleri]|nr:hypothetical protein BC940DRAFT_334081 [Gongronella butleri]